MISRVRMTPISDVVVGDVIDLSEDDYSQAFEDAGVDTDAPFEVIDYVEGENGVSLYNEIDQELVLPYDHMCHVQAT